MASIRLTTYHLQKCTKLPSNMDDICKTKIDVLSLIDIQSSNICPISKSQTFVPQINVLLFSQILKSASNSQIYFLFKILKSTSNSQIYFLFKILKSTSNNDTDVCPNLPNKSAIDLRIWKGR